MEPGTLDIRITQGDTWNYEYIVVLDPEDNLIDLSEKELKMQIRENYGSKVLLELSTTNNKIIVTNGVYEGEWEEKEYTKDQVVKYNDIYYICILDTDDKQTPEDTEFWAIFKHILFNVSSTDTKNLVAGSFIYDLEINDNTVSPKIQTKLLKGKFVNSPEVTI